MSSDDVGRQAHQAFAKECNNATYRLLDKAARSPEETETMIDMAHAARYHWAEGGGTPTNQVRADYLCSRVYAFAGRSEPALHHARQALSEAEAIGLDDFDLAYVHEAMARALACAGEVEAAGAELATAMAVPIADPEDKEVFDADVAMEPWYGVNQD